MSLIFNKALNINISGAKEQVISTFLSIYLAKERLANKQLDVATQLVMHYSTYINDGVKEPYASELLFSSDKRKEMCKELNIGAAHLNNTFKGLLKKEVLAQEGTKYIINPELLPSSVLTFKFSIDDSKG